MKLSDSEKELATQKGIVESFQNTDYRRINDELGALNKELQNLKTSKGRLQKLIRDLRVLLTDYPAHDPSQATNLNAYEQRIRSVVESIGQSIAEGATHQSLQAAGAREDELSRKVGALRDELNKFLKARGLSEENLSDVGKAAEKIAQLDENIVALKAKVGALKAELTQFTAQSERAQQYAKAGRGTPLSSQCGR